MNKNCVTGFKSQHELSQCFISHFNPSDSRKKNSKNTKAVCNGKHSQKYVSTTSLGKAQNLNTGIVRPILTSQRSPPPQPTSTICKPSNGRAEFASFLQMNICQGESLENQMLQNHVHKNNLIVPTSRWRTCTATEFFRKRIAGNYPNELYIHTWGNCFQTWNGGR